MHAVYVLLIFVNLDKALSREQWVDPHDMNIKNPDKHWMNSYHMNVDSTFVPTSGDDGCCECGKCVCPINFSLSHYKRLINLILGAITLDRTSAVNYKGQMYINIPLESYDVLKDFARSSDGAEDSAKLRQVDQILSRAVVKPTYEHLAETVVSWADHIYFTFYNRTSGILSACLFLLFISYKLLRQNLTIWSVVKYLIFLGWVTDFAFTWINLLQEAEINKMADSLRYESIPPHCDPKKMSWLQYLMYSISSTSECRSYHQTLYKDHFWSIAPLTVLSHQVGIVVLTPASHIGQAVGSFTSGLLGTLPWGVNVILLPVLLIFFAVMMCIFLSFMTQTSFGFNFLHVLQLRFGNEERRAVGDMLTGNNLSALLHLAHRNMIEEVKHTYPDENAIKVEASNCRGSSNTIAQNPINLIKNEPHVLNVGRKNDNMGSCKDEPCVKCHSSKTPVEKGVSNRDTVSDSDHLCSEVSCDCLQSTVAQKMPCDGSGDSK